METFSVLLTICAGNSSVPGDFPTQRPVTRSFHVFFDLRPNKWLSKQSWGWWFETPSHPLWLHCNEDSSTNNGHRRDMHHWFMAYFSQQELECNIEKFIRRHVSVNQPSDGQILYYSSTLKQLGHSFQNVILFYKNTQRHTAHTIVSWPNTITMGKMDTSDLMMIITWAIDISFQSPILKWARFFFFVLSYCSLILRYFDMKLLQYNEYFISIMDTDGLEL